MNYTKGDKVLFGNEHSLKEGIVVAIDQSTLDSNNLLLIEDNNGSSFFRQPEEVLPFHKTKAAPDMYKAIRTYHEHQKGKRGHFCAECWAKLEDALAKAEGK